MLIKEVPVWERPREKAVQLGVESLSNVELLAILLNTGTKETSVLTLAMNIISQLTSLEDFTEMTFQELKKIKGIGDTKAVRILAALEFSKRVMTKNTKKIRFTNNHEVYKYLKFELQSLKQETLICLYLDTKGNLISKKHITRGTKNQTIFDITEILKWALKLSSAALIIVHNHPSGSLEPSINDIEATNHLAKQAKELGIILLDHLIIGNGYYSIFTKKTGI